MVRRLFFAGVIWACGSAVFAGNCQNFFGGGGFQQQFAAPSYGFQTFQVQQQPVFFAPQPVHFQQQPVHFQQSAIVVRSRNNFHGVRGQQFFVGGQNGFNRGRGRGRGQQIVINNGGRRARSSRIVIR